VNCVYDALLEHYPSLARGEVFISPLKEEVRASAFKVMTSRKPDSLEEDEIRKKFFFGVYPAA